MVEGNGDVKLRCYPASSVAACRVSALREKVNELNVRYRFICLSLDEDRDLCSAYDFILFGDEVTAVKQAVAALLLFSDITDKCVAELLPLTWGDGGGNDRPENVKTNLFHGEGGAI